AGSDRQGNDSDSEQDPDADGPAMDGMVEYIGSSPGDTDAADVFETSPTFNFALKIRDSTVGKASKSTRERTEFVVPGEKNIAPSVSSSSTAKQATEAQRQKDHLQALKLFLNQSYLQYVPQRMVAKALLDRYFSHVHNVWPFLLESDTRERFEQTWSSDLPPSSIWMAQLNLIFALACQFYDPDAGAPLPDVYAAGEQFYLRGHGFVIAHAYNTCDIAMLQLLLLVVQYQQGTA